MTQFFLMLFAAMAGTVAGIVAVIWWLW